MLLLLRFNSKTIIMVCRATRVRVQWWRCTTLLLLLPSFAVPFSIPDMHHGVREFGELRLHSKHDYYADDVDNESSSTPISTFSLYVHIPYCRRRCNYCDFAIVPIGDASKGDDNQSSKVAGFETMDSCYCGAVIREIDAIAKSSKDKICLKSIYFGGGTPSLAPLSTLREIMHAILEQENAPFYLADEEHTEVTIEMDPGTFDMSYLKGVKEMGFNRISLGVQSFDDNLLATMGRVHRSKDVYHSVEMIHEVFGDNPNYSIDLISGVPGLTLAGWSETLYNAARLDPRPLHMSLYDLQVEKGTTFGKWYGDTVDEEDSDIFKRMPVDDSSSHPALPSAEDCAFMYSYASGYLRSKNYEHYEISSYAYRGENGPPHRSKHNQVYWQYTGQWYAIGLGSTSNINGVRWARPRALSDYIAWTGELRQNSADLSDPPWLNNEEGPINSDEGPDDEVDNLLDIVMTRLRTLEGLDLDWVEKHYGNRGEQYVTAILQGFELALDLGLGVRDDASTPNMKHGHIRLNDPKGFLFSNNIISNIFVEFAELDS